MDILRRLCERRIVGIIGEERTITQIRVPNSSKPKFYPVNPVSHGKKKGFLFLLFSSLIPYCLANSPLGIFGMSLIDVVNQTGVDYQAEFGPPLKIPFVVQQCLSYLKSNGSYSWFFSRKHWHYAHHRILVLSWFFLSSPSLGRLKTEGLFRIPGNNRRMSELQVHFDTRPTTPVDFSSYVVHDVAGILKRFIRDIPDPLFTQRLQRLFFITRRLSFNILTLCSCSATQTTSTCLSNLLTF